MYIKQITISNFRSFKQQPEIQPFTPTTNVVVGRNGSGKSNLFDAVQFVLLGPRFYTLRSEERQALLHEGSGSAAVSAFVEVVFDNSDHRLAIDSDEVVLRRTIGTKKDEFFLQRKRATKAEVNSLLETAGFSRSNPYFMVQQGKIQTLCTLTDEQRLDLLQEVAGTTLYEEKRKESLLKMQESQTNLEKIANMIGDIEDRLSELQGEKDELTKYQQADRQRKALEYTIYDKELRKARLVLDQLEQMRTENAQERAELDERVQATHDAIRNTEATLKVKIQAHKRKVNMEQQNLEQDLTRARTTRAQAAQRCKDLKDQIAAGKEAMEVQRGQLEQLEEQIQEAEAEQQRVEPLLKAAKTTLKQLTDERDTAQRHLDALYARQGRSDQYDTVEERDEALREQIKELKGSVKKNEAERKRQQKALGALQKTINEAEKKVKADRQKIRANTEALTSLHESLENQRNQRTAFHDQRQQAWRDAEELQERVRESRENLQRADAELRKVMPKNTSMGLGALRRLVEEEGLEVGREYFGTVIDNMRLKNDKFRTAVEVAAQNALFHVIVDTDATAARLMQRLESEKLGRVTFLPLNWLQLSGAAYPQSNDVTPLMDACIEYDAPVERAMKYVFDRKMLARTAEIASEWSAKARMDVITLDGDLCTRSGAMSGGYVDRSKSRLAAHARQQAAVDELSNLERQYRKSDGKAKQVENSLTQLTQQISGNQKRYTELSLVTKSLESPVLQKEAEVGQLRSQVGQIESQLLPVVERELAAAQDDMEQLEQEIGTPLVKTLSDEDRASMDELKQSVAKLTKQIAEQNEAVEELTIEHQKTSSLLNDNLLKRRDELNNQSVEDFDSDDLGSSMNDGSAMAIGSFPSEVVQEQRQRQLQAKEQQLAEAEKVVEDIEARLLESRQETLEIKKEISAAKNELEQLKSQDAKNTKDMEDAAQENDKLLSKRAMSITKREDCMRKIQELGSLPPPEELERYRDMNISDVLVELERVNRHLKRFKGVNKKAFDQYVSFNEQKEDLSEKKKELDEGAEKIMELIDHLDQKKDEAIIRTFRGVSKNFKEVFKELVPQGAGELIMRTSIDDRLTDGEDETDDDTASVSSRRRSATDVSMYKGISIKVRFSPVGENFIMSQLSGGQKALVALALIFAIQRCDPAPFYIFDELDQALDSTYRQSVANVIKSQAESPENPTQFIMSTFRPEIASVANGCYGISHQNKVSNVHAMTKKETMRFISDLMSEEEAVGEISSVPASAARKRKAVSPIAEE